MTDEIITREGDRIKTEDLSWLPCEFLCFNMREADKRDVLTQSPSTNPLQIAYAMMHAEKGLAWCITINGRPSGALGVYEEHPGTWAIWSLGIDRPEVALLILERIFEGVLPHVRKHGGHRIQARTRFDNQNNRTHLRLLGFRPEALLRRFGTDKSDFVSYVYFLDDADEEVVEASQPEASSLRSQEASHGH